MAKFLKTRVAEDGLTKLIQRLGRDCLPTQFVREFLMNSIEAIQRKGGGGKILVDVNWDLFEKHNIYKLSFWDNGDGMTLEEMIEHLNNLSSSGNQNIFENYGMGAKISALTRNHAGILYESWKNSQGSRIVIGFNKEDSIYGIMPVESDGGEVSWGTRLPSDARPSFIETSGTIVTLFGSKFEDDTMTPPKGAKGGRENWLHYYINSRFFEIPDDIFVDVRTGYYRDKDNKRHNYLRRVIGQKNTLDNNSYVSGIVHLSDAVVRWWILNDDASGHGRENLSGHTACINQSEIFDVSDGRSNRSPNFGIIVGKEDVVLYIEPFGDYVQDTTRTRLIQRDGNQLPWERWQDEFRNKFPEALKDFLTQKLKDTGKDEHLESIKGRLNEVKQLYNLSRYKPAADGIELTDPESEIVSGTGSGLNPTRLTGQNRTSNPGDSVGTITELLRNQVSDSGEASKKVNPDNYPTPVWISKSNGTRGENELEDRAAEYLIRDNVIRINSDFQGFLDIYDYYIKKYGGISGAETLIWDRIKEIFEQQLIEAVLGAQLLKNRPEWTPDDFQSAISQESLTSIVMMRYHVVKFLDGVFRRELPKIVLSEQAG